MTQSKYHFERLTPTDDVDLEVYEDAINYVFDNSDIKNIAISGAYSAGKSSVLATYKKKHKDIRFLHISLAHFKSFESEEETEIKESILEGKILNQLIHQISSDTIPQTNFRVKQKVSPKTIAKMTAVIVLLLTMIFYFFYFAEWSLYVVALPDNWFKSILALSISQYALVIDGFFIIGLLSIIIYKLLYIQKNRNVFRKLSLQGNEIEIFEESDDSYFDKYLNEVLYLFENSDADVVVFEDMDRFNANKIFERLREVNTLANIQLKKENKKELRFFYLLRDDIFITKDRTKFFDYIIPVVPVVDSSNSYDQFISHFKKTGLYEKFDEGFLQGLSLYIDDMRLLKNIYNEFVIYYNRLNTTELDCNRMLAIVAYKNLFPRDFADLQLNQGFIHTLFEKKDKFISNEIEKLDEQIAEIKNEVSMKRDNHLETSRDLNIIFAHRYLNNYSWSNKSDGELNNFLNNYLPSDALREYTRRKNQLDYLLGINIEQKEETLHYYEKEIHSLKNQSLHEIITRDNIDKIFGATNVNEIGEVTNFNEVKSSEYFDLLKYLIRYGYIDETYTDYMTYFYENSLSRIDKTFLRSITDKRAKEFSYQLKNPQLVISRLRVVDFEQEETLNFDLLESLLLNNSNPKYAECLETFINRLKGTKNFKFVSQFFDTDKAHEQFVIKLNEKWSDFFPLILKENTVSSTLVRQYSIDTLCYSSNENLDIVNANNCLTKYISESSDYLNIDNPNMNKLISAFSHINVSFVSIDYEKSNIDLFNGVYKNNLYSLNFENISIMLKHENMIENNSDIVHKNYTVLQSREHCPLKEYISQNMPLYVKTILDSCDNFIFDDENVAINLLNNDTLDVVTKKQYVKQLNTIINNIVEVVDLELWTTIMEKRILTFSASNFINYFIKKGIDETLIHYVNEELVEIDFTSTADVYGEDVSEKLFNSIVTCNDISTEKYKKIIEDLKYYFDKFDADTISEEKIKALISIKSIQMNIEALQFIREYYEIHLYYFIQNNFEDYLSIQSTAIASDEEIIEIVTWDIDNDKKIKLLGYSSVEISIVGKQYADVLNAYIITHNLCGEEKEHLFSHYSEYEDLSKTAILTLAIARISDIIISEIQLSDQLLSSLLQVDEITYDQKITLFTNAIPQLNEDTCKNHLDELGLSELKMIFVKTGGRRNYEKNSYVTEVLEALKLNHWIFEYCDDERNSDKYVVIKNKPRNK